jgi:CO/xanthine dehydrogenase Mo-binding subunit
MSSRIIAGSTVTRLDFREKVTGSAIYTSDISVEGMVHASVVRSDRSHARIVAVDRSAAQAMPGVLAVIVASDFTDIDLRFGHIIRDHCVLAVGTVRYFGEPVAVVVAEDRYRAADAARLVTIEYEDLPAVMSVDEALQPGAPLVHSTSYTRPSDHSFDVLTSSDQAAATGGSNVFHDVTLEWGDALGALATAPVVVETTAKFPMAYAYAMEPYSTVATFKHDRLHVRTSGQHPYMVRDDLSRIFQLPLANIRVSVPYVGGGYGSKSYTKIEPLAALCSMATGRPVKLVLSVEESIYTTRVDSAVVSVRSGFSRDGRIVARVIDITMDSGAYADNSPMVIAKAVNRSFGPYRVPNLLVTGRAVYTNTSPASSYRGFGTPQGALAGELNLNQAAAELGLSRKDIRAVNLARPGERFFPGKRAMDADLVADLDLLVASLEAGRRAPAAGHSYGIGFACTASDAGAFPVSTATVRIATDGSATVLTGSTELGQGSKTTLAVIAAEELGCSLDVVAVVQSDTGLTAYERTTGASRTTTLTGLAVQRACTDAKRRLAEMAADLLGCDADAVVVEAGSAIGPGGEKLSYADVIVRWFGANAGEVTGIGLVRRDGVTDEMPPFWEIGMVGVGVDVDLSTGLTTVDQLVVVGDVGFAINPSAVKGQDLGAATQGIGMGLFEELVYDGPQLVNADVVEYRVPRVSDMPRRIDLITVERRDGVGPYGAKGAGEGALNPAPAAIAAAIGDALSQVPVELPATPERVMNLIGY